MASGGWGYTGSGGHPKNRIASHQSPQDSASHTCISEGTGKCVTQVSVTLPSMFSPVLEHTIFSLSSHQRNQGNHAPPTVAPAVSIIYY